MKSLYFLFIFCSQVFACFGQSYINAIGLRLGGNGMAITVQQRLLEKISLEAIARSNLNFHELNRSSLTCLAEYHHYLMGRAVNGYLGVGGHRAWERDTIAFYGIDGIIGLEGTLFNLNTSIDYKPVYNLVSGTPRFGNQFAISIRYVIVYAPFGKKSKKNTEEDFPFEKETWL
jgi:hypothetical protein